MVYHNMMLSEQNPDSLRILILGNDSPHGAYARGCLEALGFPAVNAASAPALRETLSDTPPDLLIIDGDDPAALESLRELKAAAATMLVPVLAVCGSEPQLSVALDAGADEQVTRAAGPRGLLALAEILLEQRDVRRQLTATVVNREGRLREQFRTALRRYVAPQVAGRILSEIDTADGEATRQNTSMQASVMFADMRGFTSMAERLGPRETLNVLNEYFSLLTEIAFRHDGTIFNMSGDSLMIGYGVPVELEDSAGRAFATGSEMLKGFRDLAAGWLAHHAINVGLGIGINDGEVLAGNVGSAQYMSYTMIGDTVNVAARLSQRARAGEMLFSGSVKHALDERGYDVGAVALPPLTLRGRSGPLDIFCVPLDERLSVDA